MMIWLVLPIILVLGIVTAYTDIFSGKIRNIHLGYAMLALLLIISASWLFDAGIDLVFTAKNLFFALALGITLWLFGFWTAGDAKLFSVYAGAASMMVPAGSALVNYPFVSILVFSFAPFAIYFAFRAILSVRPTEYKMIVKDLFSPIIFIRLTLSLFVLMWPRSLFPQMDPVLSFGLMFGGYMLISKVAGKSILYVMIAMSLARLVLDTSIYSWDYLLKFVFLALVFRVARMLIFALGDRAFSDEVDFWELKPGMMPAEDIRAVSGRFQKLPKERFAKKGILNHCPEGLSRREIAKLKRLHAEGKLDFSTIRISQTLPFAPFMFAGVLFYIAYAIIM